MLTIHVCILLNWEQKVITKKIKPCIALLLTKRFVLKLHTIKSRCFKSQQFKPLTLAISIVRQEAGKSI